MSVALNIGTRTSAEQPEDLKGRYLVSLKLIERLHRLLLDVIKDEFERLGRSDVNSVQALLLLQYRRRRADGGRTDQPRLLSRLERLLQPEEIG